MYLNTIYIEEIKSMFYYNETDSVLQPYIKIKLLCDQN